MKVNVGGAESFWEAFRQLVDTRNRPIDSNTAIFLKNIDDTIHIIITIF